MEALLFSLNRDDPCRFMPARVKVLFRKAKISADLPGGSQS